MAVSFSIISGRVHPAWQSAFQASLEEPILHGSGLIKHLWKSLSCMAVSFSSISGRVYPAWQSDFTSISGRVYPAWQSAFQASLEESILHGSQLFKHLWKSLSCMAVSFSSTSGRVYPAWQCAFQASLGQPILNGSELLEESILNGSQLFKHLWKSLSYMAVSFSSIYARAYPAWQSDFTSISGRAYPGSQLFKHLWKSLSCMAARFYKHLWKSLSCMAVSFSIISGRVYPAWQSAFQASLEKSILHGSELFKHLWDNLS